MAKVIIISRQFPKAHIRAGEPTYFVEKIWQAIGIPENKYLINLPDAINNYLNKKSFWGKFHTIRSGNRFKVGDMASLRVWAGIAYRSKQIIIAPDIEIKKVMSFEIKKGQFYINGYNIYQYADVAINDGLSGEDFISWFGFPENNFKGQIICWNKNINY